MHTGGTNTKIQCKNIGKYRQKLALGQETQFCQKKKKNEKHRKKMDKLSANVENTPVFFGRCCPFSVKNFIF